MAGGLMQIVAQGAQDLYITGNPQITFFKIVYRRHTNFAIENIEQNFTGTVNFGRKATAEISRNGDLINQVFLKIVLPEVKYEGEFSKFDHVSFAWVRNVGHAIIEEVEFDIGGTRIDKHYGDWLQIWNDLAGNDNHQHTMSKMIGDIPELTSVSSLELHNPDNTLLKPSYTLTVPLQFYFCRHHGLSLPLIALQYHPVKIYAKFRPAAQCYIASEAFKSGNNHLDLEEASLYVDYIYLEGAERTKYARSTHEYLIEQLQHGGGDSIGNSNMGKFKLNFSHPSKAIYWVTKLGNYQGNKFMIYDHEDWNRARENAAKLLLLAQFDLNEFGYFNDVDIKDDNEKYSINECKYVAINPADPREEPRFMFNDSFTAEKFDGTILIGKLAPECPLLKRTRDCDLRDKVDGIIKIMPDMEHNSLFYPEVEKITRNDLTIMDLSIPISKFENDNRSDYVKRFDVIVWQHDNYGLLIDGTINPVSEGELQLNGQPRQSKRFGTWYDTIVPYQAHTRCNKDGINMFSFSFNPEMHQPSGSCNFSRIDFTQLNLWFAELSNSKYADVFVNNDNRIEVFSINYNVLRIMSGMAGLAYST